MQGQKIRRNIAIFKDGAGRLKDARGMTLVEIMIVVTIMASVAGVVGFFVFGALDRANERTAAMEINQLESMVEQYYMTTTPNQLPDSLDQLTEGNAPLTESIPQDPWGNDYVYNRSGARDFEIFSPGADGTEGTDEDVYSD